MQRATTVIANSTFQLPFGLTNGAAYVCSVTATNALGTSVASVLTAPIIPEGRWWASHLVAISGNPVIVGDALAESYEESSIDLSRKPSKCGQSFYRWS